MGIAQLPAADRKDHAHVQAHEFVKGIFGLIIDKRCQQVCVVHKQLLPTPYVAWRAGPAKKVLPSEASNAKSRQDKVLQAFIFSSHRGRSESVTDRGSGVRGPLYHDADSAPCLTYLTGFLLLDALVQ
jgi:hypothetical protein